MDHFMGYSKSKLACNWHNTELSPSLLIESPYVEFETKNSIKTPFRTMKCKYLK